MGGSPETPKAPASASMDRLVRSWYYCALQDLTRGLTCLCEHCITCLQAGLTTSIQHMNIFTHHRKNHGFVELNGFNDVLQKTFQACSNKPHSYLTFTKLYSFKPQHIKYLHLTRSMWISPFLFSTKHWILNTCWSSSKKVEWTLQNRHFLNSVEGKKRMHNLVFMQKITRD